MVTTQKAERGARNGPKCGGKLHKREGTCTQAAGWRTDHPGIGRCLLHGGATPQSRQAAATQSAELRARAELARLGVDVEPVMNPYAALAELAGENRQWHHYWLERVKSLDPGDMRYRGLTAEQVRAEISICQAAADASARTLIALTKVTSEEMSARITQRKAAMMAEALAGAIAEVGIAGEQASQLRRAYVRRLRVQPDASKRRALPATTQATADGALVGVVVPRVT
jgi:hypothetical protein